MELLRLEEGFEERELARAIQERIAQESPEVRAGVEMETV
jgi:hypothetical protein